jgi:hypothetical protein
MKVEITEKYIRDCLENNITVFGMACEIGVTSNAIYKAIKRYNLEALFQETRKETHEVIKSLGREASQLYLEKIVTKLKRTGDTSLSREEVRFLIKTMECDGLMFQKEENEAKERSAIDGVLDFLKEAREAKEQKEKDA